MVEQFNNFKGTKQGEVQPVTNRSVEITAPILSSSSRLSLSDIPKARSQSPEKRKRSQSPEKRNSTEQSAWRNNPIFASSDENINDEDDDVPEILKRLSQNGLAAGKQLSDTLSSDMIVNSISNG